MHDVRWKQRLDNYGKALAQLSKFLQKDNLNELEEQGLIQAFEYTHELAWKTKKDFLVSRGVDNLFGSKDTAREAFKLGLIEHGDVWMDMIKSRNLTSHTYNDVIRDKIIKRIIECYYGEFELSYEKLKLLAVDE
ncbi:MAG: nucleotidyltransferase substrate binding protein [Legionellaceae bacterium]|jgi:nucleotidyltransferase substrate binding protein (TIGR01987 family)|nr:nucleotidyltransferase substrate binding protein [Legionellaceae bacterium]